MRFRQAARLEVVLQEHLAEPPTAHLDNPFHEAVIGTPRGNLADEGI